MADAEALTHAFMRAHPAEAAMALESVPAAEVATLLARAPSRLAAPVLAAMLPATAARTLEALDDDRAMSLLAALGVQPAAALLRHIGGPRRSRLIDGLPTAMAVASQVLLGYPPDSVGTWADPEVIALSPETTAGDALERARQARGEATHVFIIEADHRLAGWLALPVLIRSPQSAPLETLMSRPDGVLAAQTPLDGARAHPGWLLHSALPVVERGDRLLGLLTHAALARALRRSDRQEAPAAPGTLAGTLARGYWAVLSGSVAAAMAMLPAGPPVGGEKHGSWRRSCVPQRALRARLPVRSGPRTGDAACVVRLRAAGRPARAGGRAGLGSPHTRQRAGNARAAAGGPCHPSVDRSGARGQRFGPCAARACRSPGDAGTARPAGRT